MGAAEPSTIELLLARLQIDVRERRWRALALVLLAGLAVRLWAMRFPPFPIDMADWIAWGERIRGVGPAHFYTNGVFADYAPGYLYILWITAIVKHTLLPQAGVEAYFPLFRLPPIVCDLATAAIIFLVVDRIWPSKVEGEGDRWPVAASLAAVAYAFNPATIFNSAAWGQVDATYTLLMLLAVLLLGVNAEASVLSYVAALIVKPQAISLAPLMIVALLMRYAPPWKMFEQSLARGLSPRTRAALLIRYAREWGTLARTTGAGLALAALLVFPFFGFQMIPRFADLMRGSAEAYPYSSLFAYNFWAVYGFWKADSALFVGGLTLFSFGLLLYGLGIWYGVVVLEDQLRRRMAFLYTTLLFAVYFTMLPYIVLTRMHERYIHPVLPFLLLFGVVCLRMGREGEGRRFIPRFTRAPLLLYGAVTLLYTVDLYQVYTYYRNYDRGVPPANVLFHTIENDAPVWAILMTLSFWAVVTFLPWWLGPGLFTRGAEPSVQPGTEEADVTGSA